MIDTLDLFAAGPDGGQRQALMALAARGPVHRIELPSGRQAWLVTGYHEGRAALNDDRLRRGHWNMPYLDRMPEETGYLHGHMLNQNPPDHTRLRKLVSAVFTRRRVAMLEPRITEIADELISPVVAALVAGETVDLMERFAFPLPFQVICELLGVAPSDQTEFLRYGALVGAATSIPFEEYAVAARALLAFLRDLIAAKRERPGDDLLSALVAVEADGERLTDAELTAMANLLLVAGHETTAGMIGNGMLALLQHPTQLDALRADPALLAGAVEEMLRYDDSLRTTLLMTAAKSFDLAGVDIEAGDTVVVSPLAAGLDPNLVERPDEFDIRRVSSHIAFGYGIHRCLGAPLAQLELRIAFRLLVDRLPDCATDGDLRRASAMIFNRLQTLPLRAVAAAPAS
ncbi:MAG TPA: cytochrome P450 [Actinoplanes sp.]|nr:cytochrome P450 [Actinoplanes sp.]